MYKHTLVYDVMLQDLLCDGCLFKNYACHVSVIENWFLFLEFFRQSTWFVLTSCYAWLCDVNSCSFDIYRMCTCILL